MNEKNRDEWVTEISDDTALFRGLPEDYIVWEENRIASLAFSHMNTSVDRGDMCEAKDTLKANDKFVGVGELKCHTPRKHNQDVVHDPNFKNRAHSLIKGRKSRSIRRKLARATEFTELTEKAKEKLEAENLK